MGKIKLTKKQILYDCAEWGACPESREFQKTLPDEIELKNWRTLGRPEFVAWYLHRAGRDWPNNRYIPAIAEALIATGDAGYLHRAGRDWPVDRAKQLKEVNHELLR